MANFIDLENITYCGTEAQNIFSKDVYALDLRNVGITYMDGLKGKTKVYSGEIGDAYQLYSCPFSPQGEASLAETFIEPSAIKVNQENCYDTFWNTFLVSQTEISLRGGIPQTFGDWYFGELRKKMAKEYQEIFWQGDTAHTGTTKQYLKAIDGVEKQLKAKAGVKQTVAKFTVDNVLGYVEAAISAALEKAAEDDVVADNYKVMMNYADVNLLKMALGKLCCPSESSIFSNYAKGADGGVIIFGVEVIPTVQSRNTIIVGNPKNLVLGFDSYSAHLEYKLIDMRETTGDNMFRVIALTNIAAAVIWPEGMVYASVA